MGRGHPTMVMEKGAMSLLQLLHSLDEVTYETKHRIMTDIAKGLWEIHAMNLLHRDLKSGHIVLDSNMRAKIIDFSLTVADTPKIVTTLPRPLAGTKPYLAPELSGTEIDLAHSPSRKTDIYALGILFLEILLEKTAKRTKESTPTMIPKEIIESDKMRLLSLIDACRALNPNDRPDCKVIIAFLERDEKSYRENFSTFLSEYLAKKQQVMSRPSLIESVAASSAAIHTAVIPNDPSTVQNSSAASAVGEQRVTFVKKP